MQGFHVCLKTMAKSLYVLTVHGIMDKVQVKSIDNCIYYAYICVHVDLTSVIIG